MAQHIELQPIRENLSDYDHVEKEILRLFKREIYIPLVKRMGLPSTVLYNALENLVSAILSGTITYRGGKFVGTFSAEISKELSSLGAFWTTNGWSIPTSSVPGSVRDALSRSASATAAIMGSITSQIDTLVPAILASKFDVTKFFDQTLFKVEKQFQQSVKNITVTPQLSSEARFKIAEGYTNNLQLYIQKFTEEQTAKLRQQVQSLVLSGGRRDELEEAILKSWDVSQNKAKFLAKQETSLMMAKFTEVRYQDAGVYEYKWRSVAGSPQHPVRTMHKELNDRSSKGEIFRFDQPPIDDPNGSRHNPKQNYGCRCSAIPVVRF